MGMNQTNGYDVVLELSEARLRDMLGTLGVIPPRISVPVSPVSITLYDVRVSNVDVRPGEQLTVTVGIPEMKLLNVISLGGANVVITATMGVVRSSSGFRLEFQFPTLPIITLSDPRLVDQRLVDFGISLSREQVVNTAARELQGVLQAQRLPEIPNTAFGSPSCQLSLSDFIVRTTDRSVFFAALLAGAGIAHPLPANPAGFGMSLLRGTNEAVMLLSNESLLSVATCFVTDPGPLSGAAFTSSPNLRTLVTPYSQTLNGLLIDFQQLTIGVVGNQIVIGGHLQTSGTGWTTSGTFNAPIGFRITSAGEIFPTLIPDNVTTHIDFALEWWVYALGFGLAPIVAFAFGPLVGSILAIVLALLAPIIAAILNALARRAVSGLGAQVDQAVAAGYALLPPEVVALIGSVSLAEVILDDLAMGGAHLSPPAIRIRIQERWTNPEDEITEDDAGFGLETHRVSWRGMLRATAANLPGTLAYTWFFNNDHLGRSGSARMSDGRSLTYRTSGATCTINSALGVDLLGVVRVQIDSSTGARQIASLAINKTGLQTRSNLKTGALTLRADYIFFEDVIRWSGPQPDPPDLLRFSSNVRDLRPEFDRALQRGMKLDMPQIRKRFGQ
jgi:hypothetical protein